MTIYTDPVFAPLDRDLHMERVAGGNETEVYCTDDRRYVVKIKTDLGGDIATTLHYARMMRGAAEQFVDCLGRQYSIPTFYLISRGGDGRAQVVAIQPFIEHARPLSVVDYTSLSRAERMQLGVHLREIIRRSLMFYRATGAMPDLYGRSSTNSAERVRMNASHMLPWRLWSFLVQRNLLRSHNLLLTDDPARRIVLIDYDPVRRSRLYRSVYYAVRWMLFWRDQVLIRLMERGGVAP